MSPLESPLSLAQSIISYSTATTAESDHGHKSPLSFTSKSNSNSNGTLNCSDVEAVEFASPVSSAARSEMTGTSASVSDSVGASHSSETVSEYTQELVGIGLGLNSCTSDEDYQDTTTIHTTNTKNTGKDDNDDDSGDDDTDDDDDSNLNASYIVHEEYVPYGRKIDIDSGDDGDSEDGQTSSEDNEEHGYRVKETFEHYETSDREESGYESPMAVKDVSSDDDTEDGDDDGYSEYEEDGTSLVQEALIFNHTESGDEDCSCSVAIAVEIVNDEINHKQKSPHASASKEEYSTDEEYDNNDDFESVLNDDSECTARDTIVITKRSYSHMVDTQQSSQSHPSSSSTSKSGSISLQRQHSNTSTNTLISANKSKSSIVRRGKWTLGSRIGQGSFGVVHVGMNNISGKLMAVKSLNIDISCSNSASRQLLDDLRREIDLMKSFDHSNIVRYFGCEMDSKKQVLHIFQEWVPGGSVASLLHKFGPFPLAVVRSYLHQILIGLKYLHDNHVLHRDIKGGNVLVNDEGIVKLADFGASKCTSMHVSENGTMVDVEEAMSNMTMRGTPYFMAPEVYEENYGRKADVWSCACVAHQMCTSNPPWKGLGIKSPMKLFLYITKHEGPPPMDVSQDHHSDNSINTHTDDNEDNIVEPTTSDSLLDLLHQCFHRDPSKRPSVQKLLQHSFFTEDDLNESLLEDESVRGGSVIGSRSVVRSPLSPFSPLKLMNLKRSRVSSSMKKVAKPTKEDRAQVCYHADWPAWAKPGKETDTAAAAMKSNPFGK